VPRAVQTLISLVYLMVPLNNWNGTVCLAEIPGSIWHS